MSRATAPSAPAALPWGAGMEASQAMAASLDDESFDALVRSSQRRVCRIIYSLVGDRDEAVTLTQESFLRAFRQRATFRAEARPETWIVSIALNVARDHLKSRRQAFWRRLVRGEALPWAPPDPAPSPERSLLARETLARTFAALGDLSPQQREVFVLRFVDEMSLTEIAAALGVTEGTVKAHLHRATGALRQRVEERR